MNEGFARVLIRAVLLGLFGGGFGLAYLLMLERASHALWGDWATVGWFSGNWRMLVFPVVAGLITGVIYQGLRLPRRFHDFVTDLKAGFVDPKTAPGAVLVALVSQIGGVPLGPEGPLGTGGGAAGTWLAKRSGSDPQGVRVMTLTGMAGSFAGLLSSPMWGPLLAFELESDSSEGYHYRDLIPGFVSGAVAFGLMWPVIGSPFLAVVSLPDITFESWMLLASLLIGLVGALVALLIGRTLIWTVGAMRRLDTRPVIRGLIGGSIVAVVTFTLPLTLFSGQQALAPMLEAPAQLGIGVLVALAVFKVVGMTASIGGGFFGGTIFPTFFIGSALGAVVHVLVPWVPLALATASMMSAVGGALAMVPLSMAILSTLVVGANYVTAGAVMVASVTGFAVRLAVVAAGRARRESVTPAP
jgi:H+/Cl- antiporter ClcA